ncbi:MAG: head-tail connector protein [Hyphomicrobium sp.]
MALVLTSGPTLEPVTVAEAKAHLRLDGNAEDALVASLILTSRLHIEAALGFALISQSWTLFLDAWPDAALVVFPIRPVLSIGSVRVISAEGVQTVLPPSDYLLDGASLTPRLVRTGSTWPVPGKAANGIEIALTAGFGPAATDVPAPIRHALMMLVTHWYEHRDPIEIGASSSNIPKTISDLLMPYRAVRL